MSLSGDLTRKLIALVLEQGQKFGLDVAGGFLGPAWPVVRPLVEKLIADLPSHIASRWKNNEEALDEIQKRQDQINQIGEALEKHGIDAAWADGMTRLLAGLSDDVFEVLCRQARTLDAIKDVKAGLAALLAAAQAHQEQKPATIVIRGSEIEFVDLLRVPRCIPARLRSHAKHVRAGCRFPTAHASRIYGLDIFPLQQRQKPGCRESNLACR